ACFAPLRCVAFGSCQERKLFPTHCAPNRLGNKLSLEGAPHRGPGCYDNHVSFSESLNILLSFKCFPPTTQTITPSPQRYQQDRTWSKVYPPGRIPFSSTTKRFSTKPVTADFKPGPGTYAHDTTLNQKVSWPMKFGSPDWGRLPTLERKALRTELLCDKEFVKQRSRVAYLQLFYS
uniref:Si:ch211-66i15.4 n=1 Tax=Oncorhynchus kisutch TaxID=8019 RepID=A0A8C7ME02_ONCKI